MRFSCLVSQAPKCLNANVGQDDKLFSHKTCVNLPQGCHHRG
jgi:hypothetical protein